MKCVILAGGSGDSLWPLSRKNYPKQFMNFKEGRSLLQETVVRNMPYCDEFIIVTNEAYKNIVNGQMKAFQSLRYRLILEGTAKGTAAAIILGTMFANPTEFVLIVNSDNFIDGEGYKDAIISAKDMAKSGVIAVIGVKPEYQAKNLGYILRDNCDVCRLIPQVDFDSCSSEISDCYSYDEGYLWNSGMLVFRAGDMINIVRKEQPELYGTCRTAKRKVPAIRRAIRFSENIMKDIPSGSIESLVLKDCDKLKVVEADITWKDIDNVCDIEQQHTEGKLDYIIKNDCSNVSVINNAQRKLVVANDLRDMVVVNTEDAVYISSQKSADNIKEIVKDNMNQYETYFDYNRISYREWGIHELLNYSKGYKVKKVTVFPGMMMNLHQHELRAEYWSVVEGTATITLGTETKDYHKYESVFVPVGTKHRVANKTDKNVVIIEVGIGDSILENDLVKIYGYETGNNEGNYVRSDSSPIVKLDPAFKDNLWGGTKIRDVFGKKCDYDVIGESWELSHVEGNYSIVDNGELEGKSLDELIRSYGKELLGEKVMERFGTTFPLLIKFIDARDNLSIQVHPDDELAKKRHNSFGKTEMWYVIKAEKGAGLYSGFSEQIDAEEYVKRVENNTIMDVLQRYDVNEGDVFFLPAGRVHAIGAGCFIAEIQQTSNITYRIYDYNRKDVNGNGRELHTELAKDAIDYTLYPDYRTHYKGHTNATVELADCKYFTTNLLDLDTIMVRNFSELDSFVVYICMAGKASIRDNKGNEIFVHQGQTVLIPADTEVITISPAPGAKFMETYIGQ